MCLGDFNAISTLFLKLGGIQCLKPTNRNTHKLLKTPQFSDLVIDAACSWHFGLKTELKLRSREAKMRRGDGMRVLDAGDIIMYLQISIGKLWEIITITVRVQIYLTIKA